MKSANGSLPKPLLQVEYLSYNDHFENMKKVIDKWTSVGIEKNKKGTSVGIENGGELTPAEDANGTLVGNRENQSGTSVGIYDCIFNEYRFHTIKDSVISTNVPFFEILFMKYCTPSKC